MTRLFHWVIVGSAFLLLVAAARATPRPTAAQIRQMRADGVYEESLRRHNALGSDRVNPGLAQKSLYKALRFNSLAQGMTESETARLLFANRLLAFPLSKQPELRSTGSVRTVTFLVDFADHRASNEFPSLTITNIAQNIYGDGSPKAQANFAPFESLRKYYQRASDGAFEVNGNILGLYHFPKNQSEYTPTIPDNATDLDKYRLQQAALFRMFWEAVSSFKEQNDFTQYDNDNDGDIDLVTLLFYGPTGSWNSFWWPVTWAFDNAPAANFRLNRKRIKQFIFANVKVRDGDDFDPRTLIHEMGHALGLPDYYDTSTNNSNFGGVGGLDIMDAEIGNHNAFSRWLLDWIQPGVIGSESSTNATLIASGASGGTNKGMAIFPRLSTTKAPASEFFLIENRAFLGNDAGISDAPGEGLLIWHVDATPNSQRTDFASNNSDTPHKLLRLMRNGINTEFLPDEWAISSTYFGENTEFSPSSTPDSRDFAGHRSGVFVRKISRPGTNVSAVFGIEPLFPLFATNGGHFLVKDRLLGESIRDVVASPMLPEVKLSRVEVLIGKFNGSSPQDMAGLWNEVWKSNSRTNLDFSEGALLLQSLLASWAAKDGLSAARAVENLPPGEFRSKAWENVLQTWAANDPESAARWYFNESARIDSKELKVGSDFFRSIYEWSSKVDFDESIASINSLTGSDALWGAAEGIRQTAAKASMQKSKVVERTAAKLKEPAAFNAILEFQDAWDRLHGKATNQVIRNGLEKIINDKSKAHTE